MTAPTVTLLESGEFEIIAPLAGHYDYRVEFDGKDVCHPWQALQQFEGSDTWKYANTFASLDEALDWCVSSATGIFPVPGYGVELPCGRFFSRPGRIEAEKVMAGMGWAYVTHVTGYAIRDFPENASHDAVRAHFEEMTEDTIVAVGDVVRCQRDENDLPGKYLWVADMLAPVNGFMLDTEITAEAAALFEEELGKGVVGVHIDYQRRTGVDPHNAEVVGFPSAWAADDGETLPSAAEAVR